MAKKGSEKKSKREKDIQHAIDNLDAKYMEYYDSKKHRDEGFWWDEIEAEEEAFVESTDDVELASVPIDDFEQYLRMGEQAYAKVKAEWKAPKKKKKKKKKKEYEYVWDTRYAKKYALPKKKKPIGMVVFDADRTIWDIARGDTKEVSLGSCTGAMNRLDNHTVFFGDCILTLKPNTLKTFEKLKNNGVTIAMASINKFNTVDGLLKTFQIKHYFDDLQIGYGGKSRMIQATFNNLRNKKVCIVDEETMFVDDRSYNLHDVKVDFPKVMVVDATKLKSLDEIFHFMEGM